MQIRWSLLLLSALLLTATVRVNAETVIVPQSMHTVWATPGILIEVRLPPHDDAPAARLLDAPEGASLLANPDGSHTFFWLPETTDIGISTIRMQLADASSADVLLDYQLQVDVLEKESLSPRLNPLPTLQLTSNAGSGSANEIHQLAAGRTYELLASTRDTGEKLPVLAIHGASSNALWKRESATSYRLQWTPTEVDIGYSNLSVYAVDGERPAQYRSRNLNLLVQKPESGESDEWLQKQFDESGLEPVKAADQDQPALPPRRILSGGLP